MEKFRNQLTDNNRVKHLSLPTLFEYGDMREFEECSTDRKLWFDLAIVNECGGTCDAVSTLPVLAKKLRHVNLTTVKEGEKTNSLEKISEDINNGEDCVFLSDHEGSSYIENEVLLNEGTEKFENSFIYNNSQKMDSPCNKLENFTRRNRVSGDEFADGNRMEKSEKMHKVREWVQDQVQINFAPKSLPVGENEFEKLPEMPMNAKRKQNYRVRSISEGSWRQRDQKGDRLIKELWDGKNGKGDSENPPRVLKSRQKAKNGVFATQPFAPCDKTLMERKSEELETPGALLIESWQSSTRRSCTPFPADESPREHSRKHQEITPRHYATRIALPKTYSSCGLDIPMRSSSAFSWPVSSHGLRGAVLSNVAHKRRPLTPRPPNFMSRTKSSDL